MKKWKRIIPQMDAAHSSIAKPIILSLRRPIEAVFLSEYHLALVKVSYSYPV